MQGALQYGVNGTSPFILSAISKLRGPHRDDGLVTGRHGLNLATLRPSTFYPSIIFEDTGPILLFRISFFLYYGSRTIVPVIG
jgi:hypothetical protein